MTLGCNTYMIPYDPQDAESNGAAWTTTAELRKMAELPLPRGLRGGELLEWGKYLEEGGHVFAAGLLQVRLAVQAVGGQRGQRASRGARVEGQAAC